MLILIFNVGLIKQIIYPYIGYWGNHKNTFIFTFKLFMYYPYRNGLEYLKGRFTQHKQQDWRSSDFCYSLKHLKKKS